MISPQTTGTLPGVVITATIHEGLKVTANGKPARLAVITDDGEVVAAGPEVAREARSVAINLFRNALIGQGHMKVLSKPIEPARAA